MTDTETSIVHFTLGQPFLHVIYTGVNNDQDAYIIFLDLKKAFDTVSHDTLLV